MKRLEEFKFNERGEKGRKRKVGEQNESKMRAEKEDRGKGRKGGKNRIKERKKGRREREICKEKKIAND